MKKLYKKNIKKLIDANAYYPSLEHDACGVGLVASTEGKKSRKIVEFGIQALKAVWHRGAVDADGKTGDRSEEHTSELQPLVNLVCRLLLEKKNNSFFTSLLSPPLQQHHHTHV